MDKKTKVRILWDILTRIDSLMQEARFTDEIVEIEQVLCLEIRCKAAEAIKTQSSACGSFHD